MRATYLLSCLVSLLVVAGCSSVPDRAPMSGQVSVRVIPPDGHKFQATAQKRTLTSRVADVVWHDPYRDPWLGLENVNPQRRKIWVRWPQSSGHVYEVEYIVDGNETELIQPWGNKAEVIRAELSP